MDLRAEHKYGFSPCIPSVSSDFISAFKFKCLYMKHRGGFIIILEILKIKIKRLASKL